MKRISLLGLLLAVPAIIALEGCKQEAAALRVEDRSETVQAPQVSPAAPQTTLVTEEPPPPPAESEEADDPSEQSPGNVALKMEY